MENWHDQLAKRYASILKTRRDDPQLSDVKKKISPQRKVEINLGIDFGTSYTKVSYRIIGKEIVGFIPFSKNSNECECTMHPSKLFLDETGRLFFQYKNEMNLARALEYFKMQLAGMSFGYVYENKDLATPVPDLLCAFYLAHVIRFSQKKVIELENLNGASIRWSGNLGIPIGYYESESRARFDGVLKVAVTASMRDLFPSVISLKELDAIYIKCTQDAAPETADFFLTSELEAEVRGLTADSTTLNGVYAVFDIGGGTIDGAVFEYKRADGKPYINFLTALIAPLGFEACVDRIKNSFSVSSVADALRNGKCNIPLPDEKIIQQVHRHVSLVIVIAKQKTQYDWKSRMEKLPVYLCGGGRHSKWHFSTINKTFSSNSHSCAGIPPYECRELQFASKEKIKQNGLVDIGRYLVAYGLSFAKGTFPDPIGFPHQNPVLSYKKLDISTILDEKMCELYGELL